MKKELYTPEFQILLMAILMNDRNFYQNWKNSLQPNLFSSEHIRYVYTAIKNIYDSNEEIKRIPEDLLEAEVENVLSVIYNNNIPQPTIETVKALLQKIYSKKLVEDKYINIVHNKLRDFFTQVNIISAMTDIAKRIMNGEKITVDEIKRHLDKVSSSLPVEHKFKTTEDFLNLKDEILKVRGKDKLVSTGYKSLDEYLFGGFGAGEVHTFLGGAKSGKSTILSQIGWNAIKQGKNVIHISLELSETLVQWKYACTMTGLTYKQVKDMFSEFQKRFDKVKEIFFERFNNELIIKKFPAQRTDTLIIRSFIEEVQKELKRKGKRDKIDLIIIDYDDLLKPVKSKGSMYEDSGVIYEDMIALAEYFECPILTASQTNRGGWLKSEKGELITSFDTAHSGQKRMHCFSIMTLSTDKQGILNLYLDTVRIGKQGQIVQFDVDLSRCRYKEYNPTGNIIPKLFSDIDDMFPDEFPLIPEDNENTVSEVPKVEITDNYDYNLHNQQKIEESKTNSEISPDYFDEIDGIEI